MNTTSVNGAPPVTTVHEPGSIASIPGRNGYWVVSAKGALNARGDAPVLCGGQLANCSDFPSANCGREPLQYGCISAAAATPDGQGIWAVGDDGYVWTAGTAQSFGTPPPHSSNYVTGIAPTPSGNGYYIVLDDGGVFSFGDAVFYGSTGGKKPGGHNVTGMSLSYDAQGVVNGYWLVADDGGIFTFGSAPFLGSTGGNDGGSQVTGIATRPNRLGYVWVHANGAVEFSNVPNVVITSVQFGTAIGLPFGATDPGVPLQLLPPNGALSQLWQLKPTSGVARPGNIVQLVNLNSGLCADVTGSGPLTAQIIQYPCKTSAEGWTNQIWTIANQSGNILFVAYGMPRIPDGYTLAGDSSGRLFLVTRSTTNPGFVLTGVP